MSAGPSFETLAQDQRFDSQIALVKEHWPAVRHLWLEDPDVPAARKLRSELPEEFYIGAGMPGLATIGAFADRFEFTEDGRPAIIIPAYNTIPGNLDANAERYVAELVDLVAVDVDQPDHFWHRRREALVLGAAYLEIARQEGEPVPVFKTPLSWLRSGGAGVVVLDWDWACDLLLGFDLIAEDLELGAQLETVLRPDIWVMEAAA